MLLSKKILLPLLSCLTRIYATTPNPSTTTLLPSHKISYVFSNVVLLTARPGLTCTGKVINPHWIISSGQCFRQFLRREDADKEPNVSAMNVYCLSSKEDERKWCKEVSSETFKSIKFATMPLFFIETNYCKIFTS